MILDTRQKIEHQVGDIIDVQVYHTTKNHIEIDFNEFGQMCGIKVPNIMDLKSSSGVFKIRIDKIDERKKADTGTVLAVGILTGKDKDGGVEVEFTPLHGKQQQGIGLKYIGVTTMPSLEGVEQYESYVLPLQNAGQYFATVACLGRCERPD